MIRFHPHSLETVTRETVKAKDNYNISKLARMRQTPSLIYSWWDEKWYSPYGKYLSVLYTLTTSQFDPEITLL